MYIHAGISKLDTTIHVMYRMEPSMMTGSFKHLPSKDEVQMFMGVDRDKEADAFLRGLYAAGFLVRYDIHKAKLKFYDTDLGTTFNGGP